MPNSFPPIVPARPHTLILGSMPSVASLERQQYYGFKHNAFWKIMAALLEFDADASYRERTRALQNAGIALWDVLASCERKGSLDSDIEHATAQANDIEGLLRKHPSIERICLNGKSVEQLFRKHVLKHQKISAHVEIVTLPSTSPANARLRFEDKLDLWHAVLKQ